MSPTLPQFVFFLLVSWPVSADSCFSSSSLFLAWLIVYLCVTKHTKTKTKNNNTLLPFSFLSRSSDQKYWSWERSCCQPSAHRLESLEESSIWGGELQPQRLPTLLQLWLNKISTSMNVRQMERQRLVQSPKPTTTQPTGNIPRVCVAFAVLCLTAGVCPSDDECYMKSDSNCTKSSSSNPGYFTQISWFWNYLWLKMDYLLLFSLFAEHMHECHCWASCRASFSYSWIE